MKIVKPIEHNEEIDKSNAHLLRTELSYYQPSQNDLVIPKKTVKLLDKFGIEDIAVTPTKIKEPAVKLNNEAPDSEESQDQDHPLNDPYFAEFREFLTKKTVQAAKTSIKKQKSVNLDKE